MYVCEIAKNLIKRQENVTLGFSLGKDSLACLLMCQEIGVKITPFYFYHIPDLEFINQQIANYEHILNIKIIQLPHPMLYDTIRHQDYQIKPTADYLASIDFPKQTFEGLMDAYFADTNQETPRYDIVGMRAAESFNRRKFFEKYGSVNEKKRKIYPIYDWKKEDVLKYIKLKNIPLIGDYSIWNRSWDGVKYQFLFGIKKHHPKDFETIKEYLPLIDLELKRYEFNLGYQNKS